jgi:hypothetical protein
MRRLLILKDRRPEDYHHQCLVDALLTNVPGASHVDTAAIVPSKPIYSPATRPDQQPVHEQLGFANGV